jgi:hypothetical protein
MCTETDWHRPSCWHSSLRWGTWWRRTRQAAADNTLPGSHGCNCSEISLAAGRHSCHSRTGRSHTRQTSPCTLVPCILNKELTNICFNWSRPLVRYSYPAGRHTWSLCTKLVCRVLGQDTDLVGTSWYFDRRKYPFDMADKYIFKIKQDMSVFF